LVSGWSCEYAYLYSASRPLQFFFGDRCQAPRFVPKCTKAGNPIYVVLEVSLAGCITFPTSSSYAATVLRWVVILATCGFVISYIAFQVTSNA
ncbi:hypothetical protein DOTSEDRAFT_141069, partial [Dothistroma septosporum NZE10]